MTATAQAIRAFVALDLEAASLQRAARIADRLRTWTGAPSATWTPPDRLHVTLKFIGELPFVAVDPLREDLRSLMANRSRPRACAMRLDAFPALRSARIVILGLDDDDGVLGRLATSVDELLSRHGIPREERPFRAHVTLARIKRPFDARRWLRPDPPPDAGECTLTGLTLFQSELGSAGASHTPLARFAFEPAAG